MIISHLYIWNFSPQNNLKKQITEPAVYKTSKQHHAPSSVTYFLYLCHFPLQTRGRSNGRNERDERFGWIPSSCSCHSKNEMHFSQALYPLNILTLKCHFAEKFRWKIIVFAACFCLSKNEQTLKQTLEGCLHLVLGCFVNRNVLKMPSGMSGRGNQTQETISVNHFMLLA